MSEYQCPNCDWEGEMSGQFARMWGELEHNYLEGEDE